MAGMRAAQGQNPTFEWHLPLDNRQGYKNRNLHFVARPAWWAQYCADLLSRLDSRVANSSKFVTSARMKVQY